MRSTTNWDATIRRVAGNMSGFDTLEECVKQATLEGWITSPHELGQFRTGYVLGVVQSLLWDLERLPRYMNRAELVKFAERLQAVDNETRAEWGWPNYER